VARRPFPHSTKLVVNHQFDQQLKKRVDPYHEVLDRYLVTYWRDSVYQATLRHWPPSP
jgi:hypothetical protein